MKVTTSSVSQPKINNFDKKTNITIEKDYNEIRAEKLIKIIYGEHIKLEDLNFSYKSFYDFYLALIQDYSITQTPTLYPIDLRYLEKLFKSF